MKVNVAKNTGASTSLPKAKEFIKPIKMSQLSHCTTPADANKQVEVVIITPAKN